ncbi:MAG: hypothetical protein RR370_01815 [Synergistaceae bacterium]
MQEITKLALDAHYGVGDAVNYSKDKNNTTLRNALIEINNGKTFIDPKDIRDGKCNGLFTIIEEVIQKTTNDGLIGNEFFMNFVEERNLALGDDNIFWIERDNLFRVAEVADGTQGLRRQRLNQGESITIPTKTRGIKIAEDMNRILSGRVNMDEMIDKVSRSVQKDLLERTYGIWGTLTASDVGGVTYYPVSGSYSEAALIEIIDHVEADSGAEAVVLGSRQALRKIKTDTISDPAKKDMYDMGYIGKFNGANVVKVDQRHKTGSTQFMFPNNKVYVIATVGSPIKYVTKGEMYIGNGDFASHGDLTQDYLCLYSDGLEWISANNFGVYEFSV